MSTWINTKVVLDCEGRCLEREGFWHDGPVAQCGGGGGDNEIEETAAEKESAKIAEEKLDLFFQEVSPAQDEYMEMVDRMGSPEMRQRVAGSANAGAQAASNSAIDNAVGNLSQAGVNPNSGQMESVLTQGTTSLGKAAADSIAASKEGLKQAEIGGVQSVVGMGLGQGTRAQQGAQASASMAANEATSDAINDFNTDQANKRLGMTAVGAGARAGMRGFTTKQTKPDWNQSTGGGPEASSYSGVTGGQGYRYNNQGGR